MSRKIRRFFTILMTIFLIGSSFSYVQGKDNKQIILIMINQLSFTDQTIYSNSPGFQDLENHGARGAMNINSGGTRNTGNSYFSIGGGSKGIGVKGIEQSYLMSEYITTNKIMLAQDYYLQKTGKTISDNNKIILFPIMQLIQIKQKFPFQIGAIGKTLKEHHLTAVVYGNSDTDEKVRYAPLIVMDNQGISNGDIGDRTVINNFSRPYGYKTNYNYFLEKLTEEEAKGTSLIVFDLGDLYRLEQFKEEMDPVYEQEVRQKILNEMGGFIYTIANHLNHNQTLFVLSPMVNNQSIEKDYLLSPVWMYNKSIQGNILTSATTKRDGIIANIDIAPTIFQILGITKSNKVLGQEIKPIDSKVNLIQELKHISTIYKFRPSVLYPYVMWQIFILIASMVIWLLKDTRHYSFAKKGLISMLFLPIILLYTAYWTPANVTIYVISILLISLVLAFFTSFLSSITTFTLIGALTFTSITIDILLGGNLLKRSFLGYDPIIGARYYGIGNEYMGIYIGASLLFGGALLYLKKNVWTMGLVYLIYSTVVFVLIYPTLGTNAGGAIAAIVGVALIIYHLTTSISRKKKYLFFSSLVVIGITLLIVINYLISAENQSHIGRAVNHLFQGDFTTVFLTIIRKIKMNLRLIQVSSWSKVLITSLIVIGLLLHKNSFKKLKVQYVYLFYSFYGIIAGAFVSLIVNDSGIVAASTMIVYVAIPLLYMVLIKKEEP